MKIFFLSIIIFFALPLFSQAPKLDNRAIKYLNHNDPDRLSNKQILSLNYFFQRSYIIDYKNQKCTDCEVINLDTIDIKQFDNRRSDKKRVSLYYKKTGIPIILFSWEEIRKQNKLISKFND